MASLVLIVISSYIVPLIAAFKSSNGFIVAPLAYRFSRVVLIHPNIYFLRAGLNKFNLNDYTKSFFFSAINILSLLRDYVCPSNWFIIVSKSSFLIFLPLIALIIMSSSIVMGFLERVERMALNTWE